MASVALGTKAIGSIVKLKESGVAVNYIVVHQGKPSSTRYSTTMSGAPPASPPPASRPGSTTSSWGSAAAGR